MFSKISRYRSLRDQAVEGADGRVVASKSLRLLPEARQGLVHTVEEGDRLDHLAFKYYRQPRDWWQIADANPDFLSPAALLGHEPRSTAQIPVVWGGPEPPWTDALRDLARTPGVDSAVAGTPARPRPETSYEDGAELLTLPDPQVPGELRDLAEYLRTNGEGGQGLPRADLIALLTAAREADGSSLPGPLSLLTVESNRWRAVVDAEPPDIYVFELLEVVAGDSLRVSASALRHEWAFTVVHDPDAAPISALLGLISGVGITTGTPTEVGRPGKPIVIPPRGV